MSCAIVVYLRLAEVRASPVGALIEPPIAILNAPDEKWRPIAASIARFRPPRPNTSSGTPSPRPPRREPLGSAGRHFGRCCMSLQRGVSSSPPWQQAIFDICINVMCIRLVHMQRAESISSRGVNRAANSPIGRAGRKMAPSRGANSLVSSGQAQ